MSKKLTIVEPYTKYIQVLPGNKGLAIDEKCPFESYQEAVHVFGSIVADGLWALGDLFNFGERVYGEDWAQALDGMRYSEKTVKNASWVCGQFPPSLRHKALTFNHHAVVAGIEDKTVREEILTQAEKEEMTVKQLTEIKKARFPKPTRKKKQKASKSSQDEAGEIAISEEPQETLTELVDPKDGHIALETLTLYLEQCAASKLQAPANFSEVFNAGMSRLRKTARRINFWGGNASGKKK